jgi:uncharacterized membrane protein
VRLREWSERIRHSLWFIPTLCVLAAAIFALAMVALSDAVEGTGDLPLVFSAGPDGARAMLQAIASSVITVAGVTFSITIVALQLTSTQFSPRVLRNFLRDRPNQLVLGSFMGTFTYCLLVLRSIRSENELDGTAFVPNLAITGALVLAFVSLGMLIYFIHHISVRIQVTSIVASVAKDTLRTIGTITEWHERKPERGWEALPPHESAAVVPPSGAVPASTASTGHAVVRARESGSLQLVDLDGLVRHAERAGGTYRVLVAPGGWVQRGAPIATFGPEPADGVGDRGSMDHEDIVAEALGIGDERSLQHDVAFGIQQLVDIGVKALSPSVNDPTTAMTCIDRLVEVLVAAGDAPDAPRRFADSSGAVRVEVPFPAFEELAALAFDQLRHYGGATPAVVVHLARGLTVLRDALPPGRFGAVREQARLLADAAERIELEADRTRALGAVRPLIG